MFDDLIVGAGFAGATVAERLATHAGKRVLLCDKRSHIGGNAYDQHDDHGVLIHKYGPHIFHTNSAEVFEQWGMDPSELDASVTARVPVRTNRDDRYFTDTYQAMPLHGYTRMFERMLQHPNIHVLLNSDYREIKALVPHRHLIYTGAVDESFDYCYGKLPYRSLRFEWETLDMPTAQPAPVINYPNEHAYTRVTEFKYLSGQTHSKTTRVYEYPTDAGDPYYPVPTSANAALYAQYATLAARAEEVRFIGRLGTYKYYNMDQVVAQALALYAKLAGVPRREIAA